MKMRAKGVKAEENEEGAFGAKGERYEPQGQNGNVGVVCVRPPAGFHQADVREPNCPRVKEEEESGDALHPLTLVVLKSEVEDEAGSEESRRVEPPGCSSGQPVTDEGEEASQTDGLLAPLSDSDITSHSSDPDEDDGKEEEPSTCHPDNKQWECSVCGRTLSTKGNLKLHMRTHTGEKPFACTVCGKRFIVKKNLTLHTRVHTGEKPFVCSVCGRRFAAKNNARMHAKTHTGEKPFDCLVCGQMFSFKHRMQRHALIHTREKPFACTVCGLQFSENGHLKRHGRMHLEKEIFCCGACDKTFSTRFSLKRHKCAPEKSP